MLGLVTTKRTMTGGAYIARALAREGVGRVFGIVDGTYFGFCAGMRAEGIQLITPRHETCAAHMAGAYARSSGKLGVCMASNGPGVANILPGVAVEQGEGNRVLLLTSCRRSGASYPERLGTFQSFPQSAVIGAMAKWSRMVPSAERLPELLRAALRACWTGRPGVVHLDVPESIMNGAGDFAAACEWRPEQYRAIQGLRPDPALVAAAVELLVEAERPMIHAGSGVMWAGASKQLAQVAACLEAPITTSWGARSVVDERTREALPMIHLDLNNEVRRESDVVLVLGSRLGETDWWGKAPYWGKPGEQRLIQVDIDPEVLGANRPADVAVMGCAKLFLEMLLDGLLAEQGRIDRSARRSRLEALVAKRQRSRAKLDKRLTESATPMHSAMVPHLCRQAFGDDAICVLDGGNTAVWGNFYHEVRDPATLLGTFKFGMLGAGIPQALGAKAAFPDRPVYLLIGDGAMGFHPQEIETAVRHGLPIVMLVLVDRQWGMVKMNQQFNLAPIRTLIHGALPEGETIGTELGPIAWDELARSMGAHGEHVDNPAALQAAIERCRELSGPSVIQIDVDPVRHMWAPGLKAFKDMHAEPSGK